MRTVQRSRAAWIFHHKFRWTNQSRFYSRTFVQRMQSDYRKLAACLIIYFKKSSEGPVRFEQFKLLHLQKDNVCALVFKDIHSVHYEIIYLSRNPDPYYKSNISVNLCRVAKIETYTSCYCV